MNDVHNLIIIGSGPAGYTAALYAERSGLKPMIITGLELGGQLTQTNKVDNYPGVKSILGPDLMSVMHEQVTELNTLIVNDYIKSVNFDVFPLELHGEKQTYLTKSVIIASGASHKNLGAKGEDEYRGFGVSYCATCDGFFFKNQEVAVVGGGSTAIEDAVYLSNIAKKVYLIHRRDTLRGEKITQNILFAKENIEVLWDTVIDEISGEKQALTHLNLRNLKTTKQSKINVEGLFIAVGYKPNSTFLGKQVDTDSEGYIEVFNNGTKVLVNGVVKAGVFAAGDVHDKTYRQAITSAAKGCEAAIEALRYLQAL